MPKLNEVVAIEPTRRKEAKSVLTDAYKIIQKADLFSGLSRTYQPRDEDGFQHPGEEKKLQVRATDLISAVAERLANSLDVTFTKDVGNTQATADIVVDGAVLVADAPVPFILWLEKELNDIRTFISKLPTLDPAQDWSIDPNINAYRSKPEKTVRNRKEPKVLVLYEATDKHPAQTKVHEELVPEGTWSKIEFSGALPQTEIEAMLARVATLQEATKIAREKANSTEIDALTCGEAVLDYIFNNN